MWSSIRQIEDSITLRKATVNLRASFNVEGVTQKSEPRSHRSLGFSTFEMAFITIPQRERWHHDNV